MGPGAAAGRDGDVNEEVIGLRDYGRTLTVLWSDSFPEPEEDDPDSEESESESLLPSERFYRKSQCEGLSSTCFSTISENGPPSKGRI